MKHTGITDSIRKAMRSLGVGGKEITCAALAVYLDMVSGAERQALYQALLGLVKSGEITRIRRGVYIYNNKDRTPELQEIMWRFLRVKKTVIIDDLVEISGATRDYASKWVYTLERRGIVEKIRTAGARKYRLISDPVIMPKDEVKPEKFWGLIEQKKKDICIALSAVVGAINEVQRAVDELL